MNRVLCSTGTMIGRPNGRNFRLLEKMCPLLNCDGLEFLMYDTWYDRISEIKEFMKTIPMPVYVYHIEKQIGELVSKNQLDEAIRRMKINCDLAKALGAELLVLHLYNGVISDSNIDFNIECYKYLEKIADDYGLTLTVENVVCNHKDPMTHLCALIEKYPQIKLTFDTKMADFHKQLNLLYEEKYRHVWAHIAHFHINDYLGGYMDWTNLRVLHLGQGDIDFDKLFEYIKKMGYRGDFTTEATSFDGDGQIYPERLNETVNKIRNYIS